MKKIAFLSALLLTGVSGAWAQGCSVCTQTAAGLGQSSAHGLNNGILYLAAIPLAFMATVGYLWYRRHKAAGGE